MSGVAVVAGILIVLELLLVIGFGVYAYYLVRVLIVLIEFQTAALFDFLLHTSLGQAILKVIGMGLALLIHANVLFRVCKSRCFAGLVLLLSLVAIGASAVCTWHTYGRNNEVGADVPATLSDVMQAQNYGWLADDGVSVLYTKHGQDLNEYQLRNECCGLHSAYDWLANRNITKLFQYGIPYACCPRNFTAQMQDYRDFQKYHVLGSCDGDAAFSTGCVWEAHDRGSWDYLRHLNWMFPLAGGLAFIGFITAMVLLCMGKSDDDSVWSNDS